MFATRARGSTASPNRSESSRTRANGFFVVEEDAAWVGSVASTMFSATVITGISMKCWCTIPIP